MKTTIKQLVDEGVLHVAKLPPNNSGLGGEGPLTVPIIAEDYPAKTAAMWQAAYRRFNIAGCNVMAVADPVHVARILDAFRADARYAGGGAGIGFKEAVIPHLDQTTPLARAMGSVNIIKKMPDGSLCGDNTDGLGYAESLERALAAQGKALQGARVLVLGAGGTARAIAFALASKGARLTILNRTASKALDLARTVNLYLDNAVAAGGGRELLPKFFPTADAVVSTVDDAKSPLDAYSPLGDMPTPVTPESTEANLVQSNAMLTGAAAGLVVSDIRIRKETTPMLAQAQERGLPVLDGIPMVVNQGAQAFWWLYEDELTKQGSGIMDVYDVMKSVVEHQTGQ